MPFVPVAASCHTPPGTRPMRSAPRRQPRGVDCHSTRPSASVTRAMRSPVVAVWSSWSTRPGTARRSADSSQRSRGRRRCPRRARRRVGRRRRSAQRCHEARTTGSTGLPRSSPGVVDRACSIACRRSRRSCLHRHPRLHAPAEASRGVYAGSTQRACLPSVHAATNLCPTSVGRSSVGGGGLWPAALPPEPTELRGRSRSARPPPAPGPAVLPGGSGRGTGRRWGRLLPAGPAGAGSADSEAARSRTGLTPGQVRR